MLTQNIRQIKKILITIKITQSKSSIIREEQDNRQLSKKYCRFQTINHIKIALFISLNYNY